MILAMSLALAAAQGVPAPPAARQDAPRPRPAGDPSSWVTKADYPAVVLRERQSGVVGFRLEVDAAGTPTGCTVTSGSGAAALDEATCALLIQRARFTPGLDATNRPVASHWSSRIRWELPAMPAPVLAPITLPNAPQSKVGASDVTVNAEGFIEKCEPVPRPYANVFGPPDICSMYSAGARFSPPAIRNGHPQRRRVRITITTDDTYLR